jgi:hypothetical protein
VNPTDRTDAHERAAVAHRGAVEALRDAIAHGDTDEQLAARQRLVEAAHELARLRQGGETP